MNYRGEVNSEREKSPLSNQPAQNGPSIKTGSIKVLD